VTPPNSSPSGAAPAGGDEFSRRLEQARTSSEPSAGGSGTTAPQSESQQAPAAAEPVGQGERVVRQGECISSIARDTGHFWQRIWDHAANAELKETRQNPNVLLPGDQVEVPELEPKQESGESEMRHRFVRRGEPSMLRLRLMRNDEARANQPYVLEFDGQRREGTTDADGKLDEPIPGNARQVRLSVGRSDASDREVYELELGQLDPVDSAGGIQARLAHLGFDVGRVDGVLGERTRAALREFQQRENLDQTGEADQQTRDRLRDVHGS
jgi:N-acetylmuramoyl-L-alanine amidase